MKKYYYCPSSVYYMEHYHIMDGDVCIYALINKAGYTKSDEERYKLAKSEPNWVESKMLNNICPCDSSIELTKEEFTKKVFILAL